MRKMKAIIQKTEDGYVAYPVGLKGIVVADGNTYEEAYNNLKEVIMFHIETFGSEVIEETSVEATFLADIEVPV